MKKLLVIGIVALLVPMVALGATFMQEEQGELTIERPIADDLFAAGQQIVTKEAIEEDAYLAGQRISVASEIGQDLMAAGQFVEVTGPVGDDLYAAANTITVSGAVEGDVALAAQSIVLEASSRVGREAYVAGQSVTIAGVVEGDVRAAAEQVTVGEGARITGDLIVYGDREPVIEQGASVEGDVVLREPARDPQPQRQDALWGWATGVLSSVVVAMLALWLARRPTREAIGTMRKRPIVALLTGLLAMILVIPAFIILLLSLVGIPLALLLVAMAVMVVIFGKAVAVLWLGLWLMKLVTKDADKGELSWTHALLGAAVYEAVQLFGGVGILVMFIVLLVGIGAVLMLGKNLLRTRQEQGIQQDQ